MTRDEYLQVLRDNLTTMTDDEKDDVIRYYLEYFIDSGDEQATMEELGSPEKLAVRLCGTDGSADSDRGGEYTASHEGADNDTYSDDSHTQDSFSQNKSEYANPEYSGSSAGREYNYTDDKENENYGYSYEENHKAKKMSVGKKIFLICTSPVWIPLALAGISIAFGLEIAFLAVICAVFVVFGACVAAGACCVIAGIVGLTKSLADGLVVLGGGLFMLGIGILAFFLGKYMAKEFVHVIKKLVKRN